MQQVLQPWGVVFLFGYPEGCAEIKTWARKSGTLYLRRWLTWYVQQTAHAARKCQSVLFFTNPTAVYLWKTFQETIRQRRIKAGLSIWQVRKQLGMRLYGNDQRGGGGYLWYEAATSSIPSFNNYLAIKRLFDLSDDFDPLPMMTAALGVTNRDFITVPVEKSTVLNDNGLRSKPVSLYLDLFRPTMPPRKTLHALILYGGSGNAAIAAGQLGYDVTICEQDATRCDLIRRRWVWMIERRDETSAEDLGPLFSQYAA